MASDGVMCEAPAPGSLRGVVVFAARGRCSFATKGMLASVGGAAAVVVFGSDDSGAIGMVFEADEAEIAANVTVVTVAVAATTRKVLISVLESGGDASVELSGLDPATLELDSSLGHNLHLDVAPGSVAWFSSRGPTFDARPKPDVLAPGAYVTSANSLDGSNAGGFCNEASLVTYPGTSMAVPLVAGMAARVTQLFRAAGREPNAALLRAALAASGAESTTSAALPAFFATGFGQVSLARLVPAEWPRDAGRLPFAAEHGQVAGGGDEAVRCWQIVDAQSVLVAALAWTDPPASVLAAHPLVNDLDLVVALPSTGARHRAAIDGNNLERVVVDLVSAGLGVGDVVVVGVQAGRMLSTEAQAYGLTVHGLTRAEWRARELESVMELLPQAECAQAVAAMPVPGCNGHGEATALGGCNCVAPYFGRECGDAAVEVAIGASATGQVGILGWAYYVVTPSIEGMLGVTMDAPSVNADADLFLSVSGTLPTELVHDAADTGTGRSSRAWISVSAGTRVYIGVYGYCCADAGFTLETAVVARDAMADQVVLPGTELASVEKGELSGWAWFAEGAAIGVAVGGAAAAAVMAGCGAWQARRRNR
ncbi:subtilisin [Thecamonas trahens ATCC 50062]|uniref:Subtilisin n=1 Tax=Thecamonas trahens ATCC 50062 TaxID=461836 RepID=A0A0L0D7Y4_THETB|nr:subtilisin [Thecamonas trahens ATCC 50062]KNC48492.1 subtilisin [Thecamonas trahens ATCC 50062]|eukprot:XP_013758602.1 subtilisin [Thecamonas trahens ATCC 50062]